MNTDRNDFVQFLKRKEKTLSKNQKKMLETLIKDFDSIALLNINEISKKYNNNPASIHRFIKKLGYPGFPQFRKKLMSIIYNELTFKTRIGTINNNRKENIYKLSLLNDISFLESVIKRNKKEKFEKAINLIFKARKIYFHAIRSSSFAMNLFFYLCKQINKNVINLNLPTGYFEEISDINSSDLLISLNLPRYGKEPVKVANIAKEKNSKIILITDSKFAPCAEIADVLFLINFKTLSFFNNYISVISIINALLLGMINKHQEDCKERLETIEKFIIESDEFWDGG